MSDPRRYDDQDIQAIIQRALEQQGGTKGDMTHADLIGIGEQVGLSADAIERAAHDVLEIRRTTELTTRIRSSRKRWLAAHAAVFAVINGLLFTINALTTPGEWWCLFSVVFWGLALAAHSAFALAAGISPQRQQRERARVDAESARSRPQLRIADAEETNPTSEEPRESAEANRNARLHQ
jgi:hypothetical protein